MNSQNNHHFIPAFLMREWEGGVDGKLSAMRWRRGQVVQDRYKAKSVAKQRHLYAIETSGPEPNQALEREFMTKKIDDPAALVHAAMVANGLDCLTEAQQYKWTRFLVSLVLRGPEAVEYVRARAVAALIEQLEADPDAFAEERALVSAPTLRSYIEQQHPDVLNDFGHRALPTLIQTWPLIFARPKQLVVPNVRVKSLSRESLFVAVAFRQVADIRRCPIWRRSSDLANVEVLLISVGWPVRRDKACRH